MMAGWDTSQYPQSRSKCARWPVREGRESAFCSARLGTASVPRRAREPRQSSEQTWKFVTYVTEDELVADTRTPRVRWDRICTRREQPDTRVCRQMGYIVYEPVCSPTSTNDQQTTAPAHLVPQAASPEECSSTSSAHAAVAGGSASGQSVAGTTAVAASPRKTGGACASAPRIHRTTSRRAVAAALSGPPAADPRADATAAARREAAPMHARRGSGARRPAATSRSRAAASARRAHGCASG